MTKLVICDDHPLVRRGLRELFAASSDIGVVGEAGSYTQLRELLGQVDCDVLLLDMNLPGRDGMQVLASLAQTNSQIRTLVISSYAENQYALRALKAGACGYLYKGSDPQTIIDAVRLVASGKLYMSDQVSQQMLQDMRDPMPERLHQKLSRSVAVRNF